MMRSIAMERPGEVIEMLRIERGLTRAEACALCGLPRASWSKIESGITTNPSAGTKARIARTLGVTPSRIWSLRPAPLHLDDVEDPRWRSAVRTMAQRLDREGSLDERQHFGRRLIAVLDYADRGAGDYAPDDGPWDELWRLGNSLTFDPENTPIAIIDGKLVERDLDSVTAATRARVTAARGRRARGGDGAASGSSTNRMS
jgi:transcriptional regulator with XRE-family HTH domain